MSLGAYYQHKAEQCDRLAAAATDQRRRTNLQEESKLWREIARDIAKQDRDDERGPPLVGGLFYFRRGTSISKARWPQA